MKPHPAAGSRTGCAGQPSPRHKPASRAARPRHSAVSGGFGRVNWKRTFLAALAVALAALYVWRFTGWFRDRSMHIIAQVRPAPAHARGAAEVQPIVFALDKKYRLTSVKVFPLSAIQSNPDAVPIWHLRSDSNSLPVKAITYGQVVPGMVSVSTVTSLAGGQPRLEPGRDYRLVVESTELAGSVDFRAVGRRR